MTDPILLSNEEIETISGYRQPAKQLAELHRQGFVRARRNRLGGVILERGHYAAVCNGTFGRPTPDNEPRPEVRLLMKPHRLRPKA